MCTIDDMLYQCKKYKADPDKAKSLHDMIETKLEVEYESKIDELEE